MAETKTLHLIILTQEKQLLDTEITSLTVDTVQGQITVLPGHIPLFSKLSAGELWFRTESKTIASEHTFSVAGGFLDVSPDGTITVLADHAIRADDISVAKAEEAKRQAEEVMAAKTSQRDFQIAEASLKQALNDLRVARKRQGSVGTPRV